MSLEHDPAQEKARFKYEDKNSHLENSDSASSENQAGIASEHPAVARSESALPGKNYYDILGVSNHASFLEIEEAFKRFRIQHHPDRTGGVETDEFKEAIQAYAALNNQSSRTRYDQFLEDTLAEKNNVLVNKTTNQYWREFIEREKDYWSKFGKK